VRSGASFDDACAEYLRFLEHDRQRKPSTVRDARSILRNHLLPAFGGRRLEDVTAELVERWARELGRDRPLSNRSKQKVIVVFDGLMERARRVWKLESNPVRDVDRPRTAASAGAIDVFSPDEVFSLVRHARRRAGRRAVSSWPRSPDCARASSSRCAGVTSTSRASTSA
jgi:hypothetical protein